jgi:imidazole glycerol-phosphate synthase subunit HisH
MGSNVRIAVCEHGVGNVRSVVRAIERVMADRDREILLTRDPDAVRRADRIVVPGQGSFGAFARAMHGGLGEALAERIRAGTPYLGICLGLQVLFDESDEAPGERGLGIFRGRVHRLEPGVDPATGRPLPLPHVGWNAVSPRPAGRLVLGEAPSFFYFAHSYAAAPDDDAIVAGTTDYGASFASAIASDNVVGVQFHPEKSQREGLALLERFFARAW